MHAIIVEVTVDQSREDEARGMLRDMVVPRAKSHAGIVSGYWLRALEGDVLRSVQLYDTEANALDVADRIRSEGPPPGAPVSLVSVDTYEVIAQLDG
jgi:hypothetical protein